LYAGFRFYISTQKGGATMVKRLIIKFMFIILFLLYALPSSATDVSYYDQRGELIEKAEFEKLVNKRAGKIDRIMREGYGDSSMKLEDPILLRKKRIEQWKKYRKTQPKLKV